ncbi:hypothetical protein RDI58_006806 [Solanum bulbocastanum]|uniref:Uncharacterized protein n=1 Tax=Solanum bulbocastanum TaxID=147425 RepID=A0AAN8TRM0_SOLBU
MEQNIRICELTPQSSDWICKTQIVDICGPTESKEKKLKYLNMILQDKQEPIVMDIFKHTFTFTIWDQTIMDNQGNKLLQ